jgi:hypothetical protein
MRKALVVAGMYALVLAGALYFAVRIAHVHAQGAQAVTISGGAATSTCLTPVVGQTFLCIGSDDIKASWNGAPYVSLKPGGAGGVTQITVNGGAPQTGNVALTIPTKVVLNSVTPTGTIQ